MKSLLFIVLAMCMVSCHKKDNSLTNNIISSTDYVKEQGCNPKNEHRISTLKFLGHDIICSENCIPQEFSRICAEDDNLSFDSVKQNVTVYGTTFHLNYSSEDNHYSWLPFTDSTKIGQNYPIIHLRRVRSEEGGTVIIVN